jgi:eukaryotic-like serine/threonine-protein kinase
MVETGYETYSFAGFCLCPSRHALYLGDVEVPLTPKSFEVLLYLARNPGRIITKEELLKSVWSDAYIEEGNLAQQVFRLRKAFEIEPSAASLIRTVSGRGYQFTAEVSRGILALDTPPKPTFQGTFTHHSVGQEINGYTVERWRERTHVIVEEFDPAPLPVAAPARVTARGVAVGAIIATLIACAVAGILEWRKAHPAITPHHEIVIADFENRTGDSAFDFVLRNALAIDLQQSPELTVLPTARVKEVLKQMERPSGERLTRNIALEVCARNGDQAVLTGSIARLEHNYVVSVDATDCRSQTKFAALQTQARSKDAVLEALSGLDSRMRTKLGESLKSIQGFDVPLQQATTSSFDALVAYSRAVNLPDAQAIPFYQQAIQLDPNFALAWRKLGVSYENLGDVPAAKRAYTRAYQLRGPTSSVEQFAITGHYVGYVEEDIEEGIRETRSWIRSYPDSAHAYAMLANAQNQLGLYDQAIESSSHARGLQPAWFF